jgi:hypothetical protein
VLWDGRDAAKTLAASGVYLIKLSSSNGETCGAKIILLR